MFHLSVLRAAAFAVAATSLYASAFGQDWPQRWETGSTYDDVGQAVAVDQLGDVIVAQPGKYVDAETLGGAGSGSRRGLLRCYWCFVTRD